MPRRLFKSMCTGWSSLSTQPVFADKSCRLVWILWCTMRPGFSAKFPDQLNWTHLGARARSRGVTAVMWALGALQPRTVMANRSHSDGDGWGCAPSRSSAATSPFVFITQPKQPHRMERRWKTTVWILWSASLFTCEECSTNFLAFLSTLSTLVTSWFMCTYYIRGLVKACRLNWLPAHLTCRQRETEPILTTSLWFPRHQEPPEGGSERQPILLTVMCFVVWGQALW